MRIIFDALKTFPRLENLQATKNIRYVIDTFVEYWVQQYEEQHFADDAKLDLAKVVPTYIKALKASEYDRNFIEEEVNNPVHFILAIPKTDPDGVKKLSRFEKWIVKSYPESFEEPSDRIRRAVTGAGPNKVQAFRKLVRAKVESIYAQYMKEDVPSSEPQMPRLQRLLLYCMATCEDSEAQPQTQMACRCILWNLAEQSDKCRNHYRTHAKENIEYAPDQQFT